MANTPTEKSNPGSYPEPGPGPILQREPLPTHTEVSLKRGWQTLLQSLGVDVAVALALALTVLIGPWEGWEDVQWAVLGFVVAKSIAQAIIAWVIRRFVDKSGYRAVRSSS